MAQASYLHLAWLSFPTIVFLWHTRAGQFCRKPLVRHLTLPDTLVKGYLDDKFLPISTNEMQSKEEEAEGIERSEERRSKKRNLWEGVLMYTGLRDGDPLSDWSSFGRIVPFSFCKNTLNTTNSHQAICKHFVLATTCLQVETFQSWPLLFMNLLLANVQDDFKKKHSKPGFANDLGFSGPKFMLKINK